MEAERDRSVELIANALRRALSYLDEGKARAAADTILRDLEAQGAAVILDPDRIDGTPRFPKKP